MSGAGRDGGAVPAAMGALRAVTVCPAYVRQACESGADAIVIEHPRHAGGHLGATRLEEIDDARFDFETVVPQARAFFTSLGLAPARSR